MTLSKRLHIERGELITKIIKAEAFIKQAEEQPCFSRNEHYDLLVAQIDIMKQYALILQMRINLVEAGDKNDIKRVHQTAS